MKKVFKVIIFVGVVGAFFLIVTAKTRWAVERIARIARDLHLLYRRVGCLEQDVELLDTRTDGMEFDMRYNVKRFSDYDIDIDGDYDDDKY